MAPILSRNNIRGALYARADEMYGLKKGVPISCPDAALSIGDCTFTRRQIKHIIEQRKAEHKSLDEVKKILDMIPEAILDCDFEIPNWNQTHKGSIVRAKTFQGDRGIIVVLNEELYGSRGVITAHLCSPKHISLIKKKWLHASAAGKTPHS